MLRLRRCLRWLILTYGLVVFIWSGWEDAYVLPVVVLGGGGAWLIVMLWSVRQLGDRAIPIYMVPMLGIGLGGIFGLAASLMTVLLMLFKNIRHAHLYPDYPASLMGAILERAPVWMLAGGLGGLGLCLLWLALRDRI